MSVTQLDFFNTPEPPQRAKEIILDNAHFVFYESFFDKIESDNLYSKLIKDIKWEQDEINMYGRIIPLPRLSAWYGDLDKSYTYSGITVHPNSWSKDLLFIKNKIQEEAKVNFTNVLANLYRDGKDHMGWHTDDEKELGINPIIGSVNFGASRRFVLRRMDDHKEKLEFELKHGSFLLMKGETQHYWQHQVPKTTKILDPRINLTFRIIKP